MGQCIATKNDGERCTRKIRGKGKYCWQHNRRITILASISFVATILVGTISFLANLETLNVPVSSTVKSIFSQSEQEPMPGIVLDITNSSDEDVTILRLVDYSLLVGARTSVGSTVHIGRLEITDLENIEDEGTSLIIPSDDSVRVIGQFDDQDTVLTSFLENGDTDIELVLHKSPNGSQRSDIAFAFRRDYLEKYSLPIEVGE